MRRRRFLQRTGAALAAAAVAPAAGCTVSTTDSDDRMSESASAPERPDTAVPGDPYGSWEGVRQQFSLSPEVVHMSALLVASHSRPVQEAIDRHRRRLNEDPVTYLEENNNARKDEARRAAADYLGTAADQIALTDSTTMGLGLVYNGFRLRPGDEVLTTEHGYYATHEALRQAAERTDATVREIRLFDDSATSTAEEIADRLARAVTPRTRLVALTWVHSSTGLKLPMPAIRDALDGAGRDERSFVALDGVHGFGIEDVQVEDLGCDFFMAGCHKWLFGPRGTGVVWARPDAWAETLPSIPSFTEDASWDAWATGREEPPGPTNAARMTPGGFKPFEHQWALPEAFGFHRDIGKARVEERTHALAAQLKEGLAGMEGVRLYTPHSEDLSAGIVCFDVEGQSADGVVSLLRDRGVIASTTPYATSYARLTPSIYNTPDEVDAALRAIRDIA